MPFSPFTRLLGLVLVVAYALPLVWPASGFGAPYLHLLLVWLFTSKAVRDAAPFDDQAFHRTLPPGDKTAFWRVVRLHVLVLLGITLLVPAYCLFYNLDWREMIHGIELLTLPTLSWMAAVGVAASASNSSRWKGWGYVVILGVPTAVFISFIILRINADHPDFPQPKLLRAVYVGMLVYPVAWWLVAVKRRKVLGASIVTITGVWSLWFVPVDRLGQYTFHFLTPEQTVAPEAIVRRTASRTAEGQDSEEWPNGIEALEVSGLDPTEYIRVRWIMAEGQPGPQNDVFTRYVQITTDNVLATGESGEIVHGTKALSRALHQDSCDPQNWEQWLPKQVDLRVNLRGYDQGRKYAFGPVSPGISNQDYSAALTRSWRFTGDVYRWQKLAEVPAIRGGRLRLPEGGVLHVSPLGLRGPDFSITLRVSQGIFLRQATAAHLRQTPVVVAVNSRGRAQALELYDPSQPSSPFLTDGRVHSVKFNTQNPDESADLAFLRDSILHVFWPEYRGTIDVTLPVPE